MGIANWIRRSLLIGVLGSLAAFAYAGTLTVTSPEDGDFIGSSTTFNFRISGGVVQVTVRIRITAQAGGAQTVLTSQLTPDSQGNANGSITFTPSDAFPEGDYDINVTATETGNTYNEVNFVVTLDRLQPEFVDFSPLSGTAVRGIVPITALIDDPNLKEWRVTVNDQDLPNNTGSTNDVLVEWNTNPIQQDGEATIKIRATDLANNERTQEIKVQVDRVAPNVFVRFPRTNQPIRPNSILSVSIDIIDSSFESVDVMAVRCEIRDLNGNLIRRVSRTSFGRFNDTTARWEGRVRVTLPPSDTQFKLTVAAVDKAGNAAAPQDVLLDIGRSRSRGGGGNSDGGHRNRSGRRR